jgi:two-component system, response regulator
VSRCRVILVGEDDERDAELTVRALKSSGLINDIVVARDGVEVMDYLRRQGGWTGRTGGLPGLLLLDIKMPRMSGLQVLREIRADPVLKVLPVVMLTSSHQSPDMKQAYELGANAYVVKPVGFEEFADAVKRIGAFWAVVNEPPAEDGEAESAVGGISSFETR